MISMPIHNIVIERACASRRQNEMAEAVVVVAFPQPHTLCARTQLSPNLTHAPGEGIAPVEMHKL